MRISTRGPPTPPYILWRGRVTRKISYLVLQYLFVALRCTPTIVVRARLDLVGWATFDGAAHVLSYGYRGSYPPQMVTLVICW